MPEALRGRVLEGVQRATCNVQREGSGDPASLALGRAVHEQLREAGDRLLTEALAAGSSREHALTLLAADALMTFACEAEAEAQ